MPGLESLKRAEDFKRLLRAGVVARTSGAAISVAPGPGPGPRLGLAVRAAGSVERNRIKRRLRAACREALGERRPALDVAVRADGPAASVSFQELVDAFNKALAA
jgi:ribonuclease P protein component